jgi:hypothetical protein
MENETEKIARLLKSSTPEESALIIKAMLDKQRQESRIEAIGDNRARIGYYNEGAAREVKIYVDAMIESQKDFEFFYEDIPAKSPHTVRAKIDGGVRYLVETDETGKYVAWRKSVRIRRFPTGYGMYCKSKDDRYPISTDGTLIARIRDNDEEPSDAPVTATPTTSLSYMEQLTNFIENATSGQHQVIKNLRLTANDTKRIYALFEPIKDEFELRVTPDRIIIHKGKLKTNEDTDN